MKINISFEYNKNTEIERIADTCANISSSFFQDRRFILGQKKKEAVYYQVILPNLEFSKVHDYWDKVDTLNKSNKYPTMKSRSGHQLFDDMEILEIPLMDTKQLAKFKEDVTKNIEEFEFKLSQLFSHLEIEKINIVVRPTKYGTRGSFTKAVKQGDNLEVDFIYLREGAGLYNLASLLVSSIVMHSMEELWHDKYWYEKMATVEFLLTQTSISSSYTKSVPVLKAIRNTGMLTPAVIDSSNKYYAELGFPVQSNLIITKDGSIKVNEDIVKGLSKVEDKILKNFIRSRNKFINYEQLGDLIWDNPNKYSLWAIAKKIQRIRDKLRKYSRNTELIHTVKGRGYILYD